MHELSCKEGDHCVKVVVGCKGDLRGKGNPDEEVPKSCIREFCFKQNLSYFETSAKEGTNVSIPFTYLEEIGIKK